MKPHDQLAIAIAASDLRYVAGTALNAANHPRASATVQWGVLVTYEARNSLRIVLGEDVALAWEEEVAATARHGAKFFDARPNQLDRVLRDFERLIDATHQAFYAPNRRGKLFDFLRDDLSVVSQNDELVLTNVTGHFMVGLPPDRGVDMATWGPHVQALTHGMGQLATVYLQASVEELKTHGARGKSDVSWWDGKLKKVIPTTFGSELNQTHAFAVISILSTVQAARLWTSVECCASCAVASLKQRFVVLHHAARSIQYLERKAAEFGPRAVQHLGDLNADPAVGTIASKPFRDLRNGWLHLGLSDVADRLPAELDLLSPVAAYTELDVPDFVELVNSGIERIALGLNAWLMEPDEAGNGLFKHLHAPPP